MEKIEKIIKRLKDFQDNIDLIIYESIRENQEIILDMNVEDQLFEKGINRLGVEIADYKPYTPYTVSIKKEKGQITSKVTLRDEGDFHNSFYILYGVNGFEIKASDPKTEALVKKYGKQILGLSDSNFNDVLNHYVKPYLFDKFKEIF